MNSSKDLFDYITISLASIGTLLGILNMIWRWHSQSERISIFFDYEMGLRLRFYNPTDNIIEIRRIRIFRKTGKISAWIKLDDEKIDSIMVDTFDPKVSIIYALDSEYEIVYHHNDKFKVIVEAASGKKFKKTFRLDKKRLMAPFGT